MKAVVFLGPSLPLDIARAVLDAEYLPPVAQGDVYRIARQKPPAIGIIDGYFEEVPSVWHKEILWAMAQGVHVFGASSMGALRASELHQFGMTGVGEIFEAYRDGVLEADDEVALVHGPAEHGYLPFSEPMVNVRATLRKAALEGVIAPRSEEALRKIALRLHYKERRYPLVLEHAEAAAAVPAPELERLRRWLDGNHVDQKREDALALLKAMRSLLEDIVPRKTVEFVFEGTELWRELTNSADDAAGRPDPLATEHPALTELRLQGGAYRDEFDKAMSREMALALFRRRAGSRIAPGDISEVITRFRRDHDLLDPGELDAWLEANDLTLPEFVALMEEDAQIEAVRRSLHSRAIEALQNSLRLSGSFAALKARAREKSELLAARSAAREPVLPKDERELLSWFSARVLEGQSIGDKAAFASILHFGDECAFLKAVREEYAYLESDTRGDAR
jgi:hypothetical protein